MSAPGISGEALRTLVAAARAAGATIVESPGALVIVAAIATAAGGEDHALLPLAEAARIAATSVRTLKDAIRREELPSYGKQRDRSVRRADIAAWIESRRSRVADVAEDQGRRVELRLAARGSSR